MPIPPSFVFSAASAQLPPPYSAAPVFGDSTAPVRVCVVLRNDVKPGVSPLVLLRDTLDARVFLGVLTDVSGAAHQYLEIWIQDSQGLGGTLTSYREALSNSVLDERWAARCAGSASGAISSLIHTGFEQAHPAPIFIDGRTRQPIAPKDSRTGAAWALCTDEMLLAKKGLPGYGATLSRHLYQPDLGEAGEFIPVDVLGNDATALAAALGLGGNLVPINPSGGLMMIRALAPLSFDQFCDAVKGVSTESGSGEAVLRTIAAAATAGSSQGQSSGGGATNNGVGGWLKLTGVGLSGRLVESLHLQLMSLAGAVAAVRAAVAATQQPMLNLSSESFRVFLSPTAAALPLWWTARPTLVIPGDAAELAIPNAKSKYFVPGRVAGSSIYAPSAMARAASGRGYLRPRAVMPEASGMIMEGTLSTQDRVTAGPNDLLWLRAGSGGSRFDLYAFVDPQSSLTTGEIRLRTLPQKLSDETVAKLRSGTPIADVVFELVPNFSTPCDLYALGVLAVRTLLVDGRRALPVAIDDMLSLAAAAAKEADSGLDLPSRIGRVFEADKRFADSLGPHRLLADAPDAKSAFEAVPQSLWFGTLACISRMFTGHTADSAYREFGDAPNGAVHRVFDHALEDLYALLSSCRALIVPDQTLNAEVRSVVKECLAAVR